MKQRSAPFELPDSHQSATASNRMPKPALVPSQAWIVETCGALGFGVIERLAIRGGLPCFEPEPRIIQTVKLDSDSEHQTHPAEGTPKKQFSRLFEELSRLDDATVDVEFRHGVPFRLVIERTRVMLR